MAGLEMSGVSVYEDEDEASFGGEETLPRGAGGRGARFDVYHIGRLKVPVPRMPRRYGQVGRSSSVSEGVGEPGSTVHVQWDCAGWLRRMRGQEPAGSEPYVEEPLLYALTWAQPRRTGTPPSPRNGHSMVLIGLHLFVFGGGDENLSFNDLHTLQVSSMVWDKPVVHGTLPSSRSRHTATVVGANMVVFGGVGGGNDLHILEADTMTWYVPKVGGEPPLPRFGHTCDLVESRADLSRRLFFFGGHNGHRSLSDLYVFDTEGMSWTRANTAGRAPVAGSRHTSTVVGHRLFIFGAPSTE